MQRPTEDPTPANHGYENHPAFGMATANRLSYGGRGAVLFDSDILHNRTIRITISTAERKRDLNRDWVHANRTLVEIEMSEAQWAGFVSSIGTEGVPCTVRVTPEHWTGVPDLPYDPRLALSMHEVRTAAQAVFAETQEALIAYQETLKTGTAKEKRDALRHLEMTLGNAAPNMEYAADTLAEHAENVVEKARADVEAMVIQKALQLGLDPAVASGIVAIGDVEPHALGPGDD